MGCWASPGIKRCDVIEQMVRHWLPTLLLGMQLASGNESLYSFLLSAFPQIK
jgi:hypothetical protein